MFCKKCGKQLADDSKFCPSCGTTVGEVEPISGAAPKRTSRRPWIIGCVVLAILTTVIIASLVIGQCASTLQPDDFTIRVSGTAGLQFNGSYGVTNSDGSSTSQTVDGTVPTEYQVTGTIVSVVFQKQTEAGTLKVQIIKDGEVVKEAETTAAYGVVSVATV